MNLWRIADPWAAPGGLDALPALGMVETCIGVALAIACAKTGSWRGMGTTLLVFPALLLMTVAMWVRLGASI